MASVITSEVEINSADPRAQEQNQNQEQEYGREDFGKAPRCPMLNEREQQTLDRLWPYMVEAVRNEASVDEAMKYACRRMKELFTMLLENRQAFRAFSDYVYSKCVSAAVAEKLTDAG